VLFDRDGRPKLVKATLELADAASQALDLRRLYLFNISRHRPSADTSAKARYIQNDVVHIPSDSVVSTSREGTWEEVSAHLGSSRFTTWMQHQRRTIGADRRTSASGARFTRDL
jgi:hypothetical protein